MRPVLHICITLILFAAFILVGCDGDPGLPGHSLISADVQAPTVVLILPTARSEVYDNTVLEAHPWDDEGVSRVEFLIDGIDDTTGALTATTEPWNVTWNCLSIPLGKHFIQARAWDSQNRQGLSNMVMVMKVDTLPPTGTFLYYDPSSEGDFAWRLPDSLGKFTGYGTRFTIGRPSMITRFVMKLKRKQPVSENDPGWTGADVLVEFRNSDQGQPGDLIDSLIIVGSEVGARPGSPEVLWYTPTHKRFTIEMPREFFVLATKLNDGVGDTLAIMSDNGHFRTWHGVVQENGEWHEFTAGSQYAFNPMIFVGVRY